MLKPSESAHRQAYGMNIRGGCPLRHPNVLCHLSTWLCISTRDDLDITLDVGDPCTVPCSLDSCQTLP